MAADLSDEELRALAASIAAAGPSAAAALTAPPPTAPPPTPAPASSVPGRAFGADDIVRLAIPGGRGRVPPVVTKAGRRAFEVVFPKGQRGGSSSNANCEIVPPGFLPAAEVRMTFKLMFDPDFPFSPTKAQPKIGGKLGGFYVGAGSASGGNFSATGASARLTWANEGGLLAYVYPQLKKAYTDDDDSNITWKLLDQAPALQAVSQISKGVHVFMPPGGKKGRFDLVMRKGVWNDISIYVRLNAVGKKDGVFELTVNGVTKRTDALRLRYTDILIQSYKLACFSGGSQRPPKDVRAWFADFVFSKS